MNTFFWEFENTFKMPDVTDLFPGEYYTIRRRNLSFDILPQEFYDKLESVNLKVKGIRANYAPANVDFNNIKYGFLSNGSEFQPDSRIVFVIKGAETSKTVWWSKPETDNIWTNNPGKRTEQSWRPHDISKLQKRYSASFSAGLINTESFISVETTTEPRVWIKVYFYHSLLGQPISFGDAKTLLQQVF